MAAAADKKKDKKDKKPKKGSASAATEGVRIADHPRAASSVRTWRAAGGFAGLVLAAYAANKGGLPAFDVGLRALVGGLVGSLIAWTVAVIVWRQLIVAEIHAAHARLHAQVQAQAQVQGTVEP